MGRAPIWGAALAVLLFAFLGGAAWLSRELGRARAEGLAAGRAEVAQALEAAQAAHRAAAQAALAQTNAHIADLEEARAQDQERYNVMLAQAIRESGGDRLCLGPGLVRALDALGHDAGAASARP
jgi:hypothetical protein